MHTENLAWHYTTSAAIPGIMRSGELRSQNADDPRIWFSLNQFWEPAAKAHRESYLDLNSPYDLLKIGEMLFRFGIDTKRGELWRSLWWLYYPKPALPLTEVEAIERFDGQQWIDCKEYFAKSTWEEHHDI